MSYTEEYENNLRYMLLKATKHPKHKLLFVFSEPTLTRYPIHFESMAQGPRGDLFLNNLPRGLFFGSALSRLFFLSGRCCFSHLHNVFSATFLLVGWDKPLVGFLLLLANLVLG